MGKRFNYLVIIFVCVALYASYYLLLPLALNNEKLNDFFENYVESEYGFNIKLVKPDIKMAYTPAVWVKADDFLILNKDNTVALSVKKPVIKVSLFPLILGRVNIKYLSSSNIFADISCDDKLRLSLGQYLLLKTSDFRINISGGKIYIDKFFVKLNDRTKKETILIDGKYFNIDKFVKNKALNCAANFDIISNKEVSSVNISADTKLPFNSHLDDYPPKLSFSITNLSLSKFSNFIKYFSNNEISDIRGLINMEIHSDKSIFDQKQYVSNIVIDKFAIKTKLFEKEYSYPYRVVIKSNYLLKNDELSVPSFSFSTQKFSAKLSGTIRKVSSKYPVQDLEFKLFDAKSQDLLELLPYCEKLNKLTKINVSVIKDAKFFAITNIKLKIKDNFKKPNIYGNIDVTDAYIDKPIKNSPKNADINIEYVGDKLNLHVYVPTDKKQYVNVVGTIDAYGENAADLHITSTDLIDLSEAERILMPVHKAFNFLLGPVPIMGFSGYGSIDLKVKGTKKYPHAFGWMKTNNASVYFDGIPNFILTNANSILKFNDFDTEFVLKSGTINNKNISLSGNCNLDGAFNFIANLPAQSSAYILNALKTSSMLADIAKSANVIEYISGNCDINLNIKGHVKDINDLKITENVHVKGDIKSNSLNAKLSGINGIFQNIHGIIKFDDFNIILNLSSALGNAKMHMSGTVNNDDANISFKLDKTLLSDFINKFNLPIMSLNNKSKDASIIEINGNYNGKISKIDTKNIKTNGYINFKNSNLLYKPNNLPISIFSGNVVIKNNNININKINANIGTMPTVIGGSIAKPFEDLTFDFSIFSRPNQKILDYMYNSHQVYPIKLKGNSVLTSHISGHKDLFNVITNFKLDGNSTLYYMGATIGGDNQPVNLFLNAIKDKQKIYIKHFYYDKFNSRQLAASGYINDEKKSTVFRNFKINTYAPTDMKIFNIIFKKPFIKKGKFTANILLNDTINEPSIRGNLDLFDLDVPFIDASIKNISLKFLQNNIIAYFQGSILDNLFNLQIDAKNSFKPPYVINNAKINTGNLNIDNIYNAINNYEVNLSSEYRNETNIYNLDLKQLIINSMSIVADSILINKIHAKDLIANLTLNNGILKINNFKFKMAQGEMDGSGSYNIHSNRSNFDLNVQNADADTLMLSLFDLGGQIFGNLDGQLNFTCTAKTQEDCLKSLTGNAAFRVKNGRMPKLGSLEYLLKAGNLMKSGITGLSMNGIMDLIVPLKTGSFSAIKGAVEINNGVADKIQISSEGKDLSLFIIGEYNLSSKYADMYVFGRLSRKISTIFGSVGNISLNTLFSTIPGVNLSKSSDTGLINSINKIPGLELSNKLYRVFAAEIHGDISGDEYVDSFRWIE